METITVTDNKGRKIECVLEHAIPIDGVDYVLLTPADLPVVLVRADNGDGHDELIEDFESAEEILTVADVCLAEHDLTLVRSAVTLTVAGKIPDKNEEIEDDAEEDADLLEEETDLFELLIHFLCNGQKYGLYIPLDPFFIVARMTGDNEGLVLTQEEIEPIRSIIEAELDKHEQDTCDRITTQPATS
jgi:hypothetical protein